jgi:SNF2 family DNA or RNA helicase
MQPAVRFTLDDVVELPDLIERTVDIDLGTKQAQVYKQMEANAFTAIQNAEITAMNAGAVLNKLLQISTGWVYTREGEVVPLDNETRLEALVDAVLASDNKVIVFVPFKHALAGIRERLTQEGIDVACVSGDTPKGDRDQIFHAFQNTGKYRVIAAHPQCMSHGLTLTAADTIIWFAPTTSLEIFDQANARIRRVGQKHKQLVLMFQSTKAERQMYARLRSKQKVQNLLLDMFAEASTTGDIQ